MNRIHILLLFIFPSFIVSGQIQGRVTDYQGNPLEGVNVYWNSTVEGTVTDKMGMFVIDTVQVTKLLKFSNVSFETDSIYISDYTQNVEVKLNDVISLKQIDIVQKNPGTYKVRTAAIHTEKITAAELCKAACCNLSESFVTNPSVDVSYSDAATGAKQIKLLGLSGTYVQMLTENIPNLRGISSVYGLGYTPGPWMESIQVSKGTGSVINGYEAFTGQINVEYKKPESEEIAAANLFLSDAGRAELNLSGNMRINPYLSTGILFHASDEFWDIDHNKDGFSDAPMIRQINFINRWNYKKDAFSSQIFFRGLSEDRVSGMLDKSYLIDIITNRYEFFLKNGYVFNQTNNSSLGWIISGSMHSQDAGFGFKSYRGTQNNLYSNLIFHTNILDNLKISTGLSFNADFFDESIIMYEHFLDDVAFDIQNITNEYSTGAFAEISINAGEQFNALVGFRTDYHNKFGFFVTPRLHLKYTPNKYWIFRATGGKGYKSPQVLAENAFYLAGNRILNVENNLKMEEAFNTGIVVQAFPEIMEKEIVLSAEWYHTSFQNQVVIDLDKDAYQVYFSNLQGKSYAGSVQLEASLELFKGFSLTLAQRWNDVKSMYNGVLREKPLTNRYKGLITASYQTNLKKWQFDFTTQFNGGGRMPDPDVNNPAWSKEFPAYTIFNGQITRYFPTWSLYLGSENLGSFTQKNPVIDVSNPYGSKFDATMIWGPTHGRKIYLGMRWALDRKGI
jgi:outer membrane receptor for ferrienterochelin and colicin